MKGQSPPPPIQNLMLLRIWILVGICLHVLFLKLKYILGQINNVFKLHRNSYVCDAANIYDHIAMLKNQYFKTLKYQMQSSSCYFKY